MPHTPHSVEEKEAAEAWEAADEAQEAAAEAAAEERAIQKVMMCSVSNIYSDHNQPFAQKLHKKATSVVAKVDDRWGPIIGEEAKLGKLAKALEEVNISLNQFCHY